MDKNIKRNSQSEEPFKVVLITDSLGSQIDYEQIRLFKPDICICQFGIVDCSRRIAPRRIEKLLFGMPFVGKGLIKTARRYHFQLTKLFHHHIVSIDNFEKNIDWLIDAVKEVEGDICFIRIVDAGEFLIKKTYDIQNDISRYNEKMMSKNAIYLDSYNGLVFSTVNGIMKNILSKVDIGGEDFKFLNENCSRKTDIRWCAA